MATELRLFYSPDYVTYIADCLVEHGINRDEFVARTHADPWEDLTLKERMARLTNVLVDLLPEDPEHSLDILKDLLPKVSRTEVQKYADMLSMFVPDYMVERKSDYSIEDALAALTHFTHTGTSSEFAIRPFLLSDLEDTMAHMQSLADHEHPDVRRFASEGCRPRLPWALGVPDLKADPAPIWPILEKLKADDSKFVQKSVANNLNDIAKDHPDQVIRFAQKHMGTHPNTNWILKHGLRTLLKAGHPEALALFGATPVTLSNAKLALSSASLVLGETQEIEFSADLLDPRPEILRLEYAVDFVKTRGKTSRKVFMIKEGPAEGNKISLNKAHKFIDHSTRKHHAGEHRITLLANGAEITHATFDLILP